MLVSWFLLYLSTALQSGIACFRRFGWEHSSLLPTQIVHITPLHHEVLIPFYSKASLTPNSSPDPGSRSLPSQATLECD